MLTIKKYLVVFIIGAIAGIAGTFYIMLPSHSSTDKNIKVTKISGEKIEHSSFKSSGTNFSFYTTAEGPGAIFTEIPKEMIPEANAYLHQVHNLQFSIQSIWYNERFNSILGISYLHRWGRVSFGGGPLISGDAFGAQVIGQWSW